MYMQNREHIVVYLDRSDLDALDAIVASSLSDRTKIVRSLIKRFISEKKAMDNLL